MRANFKLQRLFIQEPLSGGHVLSLDRDQANYLLNVLRLKDGADILVFNGQDGEWRGQVSSKGRKKAAITLMEQVRPQAEPSALTILFAPIKVGRLDYMVQKMTEMGAGRIQPVFTDHTQLHKINETRLKANIIEACEQCGVLNLPTLSAPLKLQKLLEDWDDTIPIIFCDEGCETDNPLPQLDRVTKHEFALLIGPEGGFSDNERAMLRARDHVIAIALGPRILRADTALVAAMALVQASIGDWNQ